MTLTDVYYFIMSAEIFTTVFKLLLIVILSAIVGHERETWNKPAGFATYALVGISATLAMICGKYMYNQVGNIDPTRLPAQLLSGIGFLGAGTILKDGFNVKGLTTTAGLLAITCIGLEVGAGDYLGAIFATIIVFLIMKKSHKYADKQAQQIKKED